MSRKVKMRKKNVGSPPGTLVHVSDIKSDFSRVTLCNYDEVNMTMIEERVVDECVTFRDKPTVTWINVNGIHEVSLIEKLGDCFSIHPLVLEDILNTTNRSKFEDYEEFLFIIIKLIDPDSVGTVIKTESISLVLGSNFVLSFQETAQDIFNPVRERLRSEKGRIRKSGTDYLSYALIDLVVDHNLHIAEILEEKIEQLETELLTSPTTSTLEKIYHLKRDTMYLKKMIAPVRDIINSMLRDESPLIKEMTKIFLRDVLDHITQVIETIDTSRDSLVGMLDTYLSSISFKMNNVMKFLTIIATIFIPLTFIAGIYGMNFKHMPELEWTWGYPGILIAMLVLGFVMVGFFKRKGWF
ncbi:magnesium/cobalt transporter CorA [candidate division CSSED10-310 bacterium]|uniref:Magnesium transport protein CorA n=1 Tax=candidate division CSSED10-310 bacterium TaxID=2855610 RepID=A0ABV6YY10_UNCC1